MAKKKKIEAKCKNCRLFNPKAKRCMVVVLHEGEQYNIPVEEEDDCFFNNEFVAIDDNGCEDKFKPEVEQVRFWVEDPDTGEPTKGEGLVKIEYPEGFFGKDD